MSGGIFDILKAYFCSAGEFKNLGVKNLRKNYKWRVPDTQKFGFVINSQNPYEQNIELKGKLNEWWLLSSFEDKKLLANWIVSIWGGIKSNSAKTMTFHIDNCMKDNPELLFKGVATYSKILMSKNSKKYAVFDSRVVVSLNAIQLLGNVEEGIFFPYLNGRNVIIGNKYGFASQPEFSRNAIKNRYDNWSILRRNDAYAEYLRLLHYFHKEIGFSISDMEMALFSDAEQLALLIQPSLIKNRKT